MRAGTLQPEPLLSPAQPWDQEPFAEPRSCSHLGPWKTPGFILPGIENQGAFSFSFNDLISSPQRCHALGLICKTQPFLQWINFSLLGEKCPSESSDSSLPSLARGFPSPRRRGSRGVTLSPRAPGAGAGRGADGAAGGKVAGSCPAGALVLGFAL